MERAYGSGVMWPNAHACPASFATGCARRRGVSGPIPARRPQSSRSHWIEADMGPSPPLHQLVCVAQRDRGRHRKRSSSRNQRRQSSKPRRLSPVPLRGSGRLGATSLEPEADASNTPPARKRPGRTATPRTGWNDALANQGPEQFHRTGSECHAQADFARPSQYSVERHRIDAAEHEDHRRRREHGCDQGGKARLRSRSEHQLVERRD